MTDAPQAPLQPPVVPPPKQDNTMVWLPHLLMILTGWVGPLILWLVKKDEDKLAAFHAKQAMCWSLAMMVLGLLLCCVGGVVTGILVLVYGIMAIMATSKGEPFKYPWVADKFCSAEFAAAYPHLAGQAGQAAQQPPTGR